MEIAIGQADCFDNLLLDDLMDEGVVKLDVNVGLEREVAVLDSDGAQVKASPSHESDSGISVMSSPCHSLLSDEESHPGDFESENEIFPNLFDTDIVDYLCGENSGECDSDMNGNIQGIRRSKSTSVNFSSEDTENECPSIDFEKTNIDKLCKVSTKVHQTIADIFKPTHKIVPDNTRQTLKNVQPIVPSMSCKSGQNLDQKPPAVKVIKVIKTPSASTKKEAEQQIYEALEERNRKNAIQAKMNREKKKAYMKSLEEEINDLKVENDELREGQDQLKRANSALEDEVAYLKSVIANQSSLSNLLKNIPSVKNVKLSSSFSRRKRSAVSDHDYELPAKRTKNMAGVCLHVLDSDNVSLEFCARCSQMSRDSSDGED
ncbi:hypothetical protein FSP39_012948 [Pinctada imbricata]|uniref:BZIP domain-containing protein n=1 Tax=Pinctada imbricata TaxID=66713 RepID=A0AA89CC38_PINIB|nr:hypothetical protein FSP39_012948 [Pinctada imbricata]